MSTEISQKLPGSGAVPHSGDGRARVKHAITPVDSVVRSSNMAFMFLLNGARSAIGPMITPPSMEAIVVLLGHAPSRPHARAQEFIQRNRSACKHVRTVIGTHSAMRANDGKGPCRVMVEDPTGIW